MSVTAPIRRPANRPTAGRVRRRARTLSAAASSGKAADPMAWMRDRIAALALPVDADRAAAALPATVLVAGAVAVALLGFGGAVVLVVAAGAVGVSLHRSAPRRRAASSERALPLVLDAVARQLRAGSSLPQAVTSARPPAGAAELRRSWDRLADLIPLVGVSAAIDDWAAAEARSSVRRSVHLTSAALALAAATGGSPARAIDGVAATLRSRLAVADEVRALSAQARASAAVIAAAPVVFGALAGLTDPRTRAFLASPAGLGLLVAGVGLDAVGAWWMVRLCRAPEPA